MVKVYGYMEFYPHGFRLFEVDVPQWVSDMADFRADHDLLRTAEVYTSLAVYGRVKF